MRKLFFTLSLLLMCTVTFAVPAKRGIWKTVRLADGTEVRVELRGDELCRYWQSEDGRRFMKNADTGVFEAVSDERINATGAEQRALVGERRAARLMKNSRVMAAAANGTAADATDDTTLYSGTRKGLIVLVDFADTTFQAGHGLELYKRIANEEGFSENGFSGSIKDYFRDQSYGTFELDFDVVGPVTMPNGYAYYGKNDRNGSDTYTNIAQMVVDACKAVEDELDFTQYDWNGDGEVDQVFILFAGCNEAAGGGDDTIWPHESSLEYWYPDYRFDPPQCDGVTLRTYACGSELTTGGRLDGIGTICHEFAHCLGLKDMYDTQYGGAYGLDAWSLMAAGNYNGNSYIPAGLTSYERWQAGWVTPVVLTEDVAVSDMKPLNDEPEAYIIYNDANSNEYYLLENRYRTGWDAGVPGSGLLILHVDYNYYVWLYNIINSPAGQRSALWYLDPHERCGIIQADEGLLADRAAADVWPQGTVRNKLSKSTTPAAKVYNANTDGTNYMNKTVSQITRKNDGTMSFNFSVDKVETGIDGVTVDGAGTAAPGIYDVDGRYVGNDFNSLQKGIYIVNGRKVVK